MSNILSLKEIVLQNKLFEELNENLIQMLELNNNIINIPNDITELIGRSGILLYQALRLNHPNTIIIVYNLLTKFKSNIGDLNSLLLLRDLFLNNSFNGSLHDDLYKNCYEIITKNIIDNFITNVNYKTLRNINFKDKITKKTRASNSTYFVDINQCIEYTYLKYNFNTNDINNIDKFFDPESFLSYDNKLRLNIFGNEIIANKSWNLIQNIDLKSREMIKFCLTQFMIYLIQSNNIVLFEKYLLIIYNFILTFGNINNKFIISKENNLYVMFDYMDLYLHNLYNLYNIQLFKIISRINQLKKIKCRIILLERIYSISDDNDDENVITSIFSIYKHFYPNPNQRKNINKYLADLNKKYGLKLIPINFNILTNT